MLFFDTIDVFISLLYMSLYQETKIRSLVKTVIWRLIATFITWATVYSYTHQLFESLEITIVAAFIGMTVYYVHERVWNYISWGKHTSKE